MMDVIRAPAQARSQRTMDDVYRSLDEMLKTSTFDRITIADLASHASVAVGSIYARFKDKNALLAGLHLRVSEQAIACLGPLSAPAKWEGRSDHDLVRLVLRVVDRFYRREAHILSAAYLADTGHINDMRLMVWQAAVDRFTALLVSRSPEADPVELQLAVRVVVRLTTGVMMQSVLVDWVSRWKSGVSNALVLDELTRYCVDAIGRARNGNIGPAKMSRAPLRAGV